MTLDLTAMYVKQNNQNRISQGQYFNPLVPLYLFPRGDDIDKYKVFEEYNPSRGFNTQFWPAAFLDQGLTVQNPYWIVNRNIGTNSTDRYILGANLRYNVLDWLNITARIREDNTLNISEQKNYASTLPFLSGNSNDGFYSRFNETTNNTYADLIAEVNKKVGSYSILAHVGGIFNDTRHSLIGAGGGLANVPNLFNFNNLMSNVLPQQSNVLPDPRRTQSTFADAQISYKTFLTLTASERGDLSSNLPNRWVYYPSVGLSAVISDMFRFPQPIISYLKIRGSYAEVGTPPPPYIANPVQYTVTGNGVSLPDFPFPNLQPQRTKSTEAGLDVRFLNDALSLSVTVYKSNTYNQLFTINGFAGSAYNSYFINAGNISNKGIEASLALNTQIGPVKWNSSATFTLNRNKIIEMASNVPNPAGQGFVSQDTLRVGNNYIVKGGAMSDVYVNGLRTDEYSGFFTFNNGSFTTDFTNLIKAGRTDPDFTVSFGNQFSYQNFSLGFRVNGRFGGVGISQTQAAMDFYGVSVASAEARDRGSVNVNGLSIDPRVYYQQIGAGLGVQSFYVYSTTNIRLAEASIGYTIPAKLFHNVIKGISLSLIGRNLFMFYNKAPFDPESTASTGTYYQGVDYFKLPSYRSIGFSIKAKI